MRRRDDERLAPGWSREQARTIVVGAPGRALSLARVGGAWRAVGDAAALAVPDGETIDRLLAALEVGSVLRRLGPRPAAERRALGLDPPRLVLTVDALTLHFGADAPGSRCVYLERVGEPSVLVGERRLYELAATALDARADGGRAGADGGL
jgi:hypothetical protein